LVVALREIDQPWILQKLLDLKQRGCRRYSQRDPGEESELVYQELNNLRELYEKAASAGLPVVCTISH
jgi:hypothetical protein